MKQFLLSIFLSLVTLSAYAFDAKSKPIQVVIPFAPGGGVDQTFRHIQKYAEGKGIIMVPVYKAGADGLIGMNELASMPKDGYHISVGTAATVAVQRIKSSDQQLELVTAIKNSIMALVVSNNSGIVNITDLESKIKNKQKLNIGFGAPGQKMILDQLVDIVDKTYTPTMVPYKGGAPVVADLVGGHIDVAFVPFSIVKSHIDAGSIKLVAVSSRAKPEGFENTVSLVTRYKGWENSDAFAFLMPANSNKEALNFWSSFMKDYMNNTDNQKHFVKEFTEISPFGQPTLSKYVNDVRQALEKIK